MSVFETVEEMERDLDKRITASIEKLVHDFQSGNISHREMRVAIQALDATLRFYAPADTNEIIDAVMAEKVSVVDYMVFNKGNVKVSLGLLGKMLIITQIKGNVTSIKSETVNGEDGKPCQAAARMKMAKLVEGLRKKGMALGVGDIA